MAEEVKKIELWEGYEVEINEQLLDDFNFITDLDEARRTSNTKLLMQCVFGLLGGEKVFKDTEAHITKEKGYFSTKELMKIIEKVSEFFPKAGQGA